MAQPELNAIVTQKTEHAPGLMTLRLAPDGWELPEFIPGQFVVLGLPGSAPRTPLADPDQKPLDPDKVIRRAYSVASSSVAKEYAEFYISLVRSGELTPRLFNLKLGDKVFIGKKFTGFFTLEDVPEDKNVILVATGTGLAPYMSMIRSELSHEHKRRVAIIHGAYHTWDLGYHGELAMMQRISPSFTYIPVISNPEQELTPWSGETGYVQGIWEQKIIEKAWGFTPTCENTHVFLCGHPLMIESMETILQGEGYVEHTRKTPGTYHLERYF